MRARIILKTHSECLRPALYSLIVLKYTHESAVRTDDAVVRAVQSELGQRGFSGPPESKRESAIKFALWIAERDLHLVRSNLTWDWSGQVLNAVLRESGRSDHTTPRELATLKTLERVFFLKSFLEADGALICALVSQINSAEPTSKEKLFENFDNTVEQIFENYEASAVHLRDRMQVRKRRREVAKQIQNGSRQRSTIAHKVVPHIQLLSELGLVEHCDGGDSIRSAGREACDIAALAQLGSDPVALDELFVSGNPYELVSRVYRLSGTEHHISVRTHWDEIVGGLKAAYETVRDETTGMAHINAVVELCCLRFVSHLELLLSPNEARLAIQQMYERDPDSIRFHVDFGGNPAYMILP